MMIVTLFLFQRTAVTTGEGMTTGTWGEGRGRLAVP